MFDCLLKKPMQYIPLKSPCKNLVINAQYKFIVNPKARVATAVKIADINTHGRRPYLSVNQPQKYLQIIINLQHYSASPYQNIVLFQFLNTLLILPYFNIIRLLSIS